MMSSIEPYKIKQKYVDNKPSKWSIWVSRFISLAGAAIFIYGLYDFFAGTDVLYALRHILLGALIFFYGTDIASEDEPLFPEITLKEKGIEYKKGTQKGIVNWSKMETLTVTPYHIVIQLQSGRQKELDTGLINYKELQIVKEKLQAFAQSKNIAYSSKY